jgi:hypothetical protein
MRQNNLKNSAKCFNKKGNPLVFVLLSGSRSAFINPKLPFKWMKELVVVKIQLINIVHLINITFSGYISIMKLSLSNDIVADPWWKVWFLHRIANQGDSELKTDRTGYSMEDLDLNLSYRGFWPSESDKARWPGPTRRRAGVRGPPLPASGVARRWRGGPRRPWERLPYTMEVITAWSRPARHRPSDRLRVSDVFRSIGRAWWIAVAVLHTIIIGSW